LVHSLSHPKVQSFPTLNGPHYSHFPHLQIDLHLVGHSVVRFVMVLVRMGEFDCSPSAWLIVIEVEMVSMPFGRASVGRDLEVG